MKPWGGIEQLAWNTTSDKVAYTCRQKNGTGLCHIYQLGYLCI